MEMESSNSKQTLPKSNNTRATEAGAALNRRNKRKKCLAITAAIILLVVVLIIILSTTVFKPKHPTTTVQSISLDSLRVSFSIARLSLDLNVSLHVDLTVYNPNRVSFKFGNSNTILNYRGQTVGDVPVPAGEIGSRGSLPLNLTLNLMADRLLSDSTLYSDVLAGELLLNTHTRISGKVKLLNVFRFHVVSTTTCDFTQKLKSLRKRPTQQTMLHEHTNTEELELL